MAEKQSDFYLSGESPKSSILKSSHISRLSSLFGFRATNNKDSSSSKKYGMDFVRVDLNNDAYRVKNASLGNVFKSEALDEHLEKYFDAYMSETTLSYNDIQDRQKRLNELSFFYYNDNFGYRVVELVAAEATQLDVQNRILTVESPNQNFMSRCYELFSIWGITQQRLQQVCHDLELYGESFWTQKITRNGVERVNPIRVNSVMERLEFSPVRVAEFIAQKDGYLSANKSRHEKIRKLLDLIKSEEVFDKDDNLADMFDTKLIGFELQDGIVAAPWEITHFRYNAENSEFFPYGRPPLLGCLSPFKQSFSTIMLQGLARQMSFPVTMYKVKGVEGMGPEMAFEHVNTVREEYDNLGVNIDNAGGEVYTVNTKMWVPNDLVDVEVKESKCDIDFVGDIELYQDRVAIASGVPKAYLDQEFGGFGNSGVSLTEQYKPFARHVYTIQSACLEGIGNLIRLHFAITGEFDYNTPFVLSMRFPAEEMGSEKRDARSASIDLANSVLDLISSAIGAEEGETLPQDVVTDILSKYTFLDPTDVQKWMKISILEKPTDSGDSEEGGDDDFGDFGSDDGGGDIGMDSGADMGGDAGVEEAPDDTGAVEESIAREKLLKRKKWLKEVKAKRLKEISQRYKETKEDIYFKFLENNHITEWQGNDWMKNTSSKGGSISHNFSVPKIEISNPLYESFKVLSNDNSSKRLHEDNITEAVYNKMSEIAQEQQTEEEESYESSLDDLLGDI